LGNSYAIAVRRNASFRHVIRLSAQHRHPFVVTATMLESFAKACSDIHEIALIRDRI
jgi:hypothetical protein